MPGVCVEKNMKLLRGWCYDQRRWTLIVLLTLAATTGTRVRSATLSIIPDSQGFGMQTRAGYGGSSAPTVYRVTNLNDDGSESFRAALEATIPRVVIFEVSGTISLNSDILITSPYLTVAGQTAPSPGITVKNHGLYIYTNDVLLQHLRIRPGGDTCNSGLQVYGGIQSNIVLDHMSFSWGQDENVAFNGTNGQATNATLWRSIVAEGLYRTPGSANCPGGGTSNGHGVLIDSGAFNVAIVQSLLAKNLERNPYMLADTRTVLVNNLIYQWHGPWGFFFNNGAAGGVGGPWYASVVGNRFIKGPETTDSTDPAAYMFVYSINGAANVAGNKIYRSDNTLANQDGTVIEEMNQYRYDPNVGGPPAEAPLPAGLSPLASGDVEAFVLANAGARPVDRDSVDARIVSEVSARSGTFIQSQNDVGGWPVLATRTRTLTTPANPNSVTASGYTALEDWLHAFAAAVEGTASRPGTPSAQMPNTLHIIR